MRLSLVSWGMIAMDGPPPPRPPGCAQTQGAPGVADGGMDFPLSSNAVGRLRSVGTSDSGERSVPTASGKFAASAPLKKIVVFNSSQFAHLCYLPRASPFVCLDFRAPSGFPERPAGPRTHSLFEGLIRDTRHVAPGSGQTLRDLENEISRQLSQTGKTRRATSGSLCGLAQNRTGALSNFLCFPNLLFRSRPPPNNHVRKTVPFLLRGGED